MTCTNNCGSCQCTERAALIAALERMGFVAGIRGDYIHDDLYMIVRIGDGVIDCHNALAQETPRFTSSADVLEHIRPYRIRAAIADYLRTVIGAGLAVDGELVGIEDLIEALEA